MSVPSSWAIRNENLGGRRVDKHGKGDPGASQSGETSQICGSIGAGFSSETPVLYRGRMVPKV